MRQNLLSSLHRALRFTIAGALAWSAAGGLTGCARAVITTTVRPDGSWTRADVFHGMPTDLPTSFLPKGAGNGKGDMGLGMLASFGSASSAFKLPEGAGWSAFRKKTDMGWIYSATREMQAGAALDGDVSAKAMGASDVIASSGTTVRQVAPGRFEYREVIHWTGKPITDSGKPEADSVSAVKAAVPAGVVTEADINALATRLNNRTTQAFFGPPSPLMARFMEMAMLPDSIQREMERRIGPGFVADLKDRLGDKLTDAQRIDVVRKIVHSLTDMGSAMKSGGASGGMGALGGLMGGSSEASMASVTYSVQLPGKVIESNGEIDGLTGEVYWSLYPMAAAAGDITLRAVCDTGAGQNAGN